MNPDYSMNPDYISTERVGRLYVQTGIFSEGLLHHLSSIVPALIIRQRHVSGIASTENYFFGVENVRWKPIFVDMLRRKLEKLKIVNFAYKQYLSREHTLDLMEVITNLSIECPFSYRVIISQIREIRDGSGEQNKVVNKTK